MIGSDTITINIILRYSSISVGLLLRNIQSTYYLILYYIMQSVQEKQPHLVRMTDTGTHADADAACVDSVRVDRAVVSKLSALRRV